MFIAYDEKNGVEYAKLCTSIRRGDKVTKSYVNLGRVLDRVAGIYKNRDRGVFTYDLETDAYGIPPASFILPAKSPSMEKLVLDFGDVFTLSSFMKSSGIMSSIEAVGYGNPDSFMSMICFYILGQLANCHANDWWEGSYARILYPNSNLTSQRISELLADIGKEDALRRFFGEYIPNMVGGSKGATNVLIDSTGLPNSIHFPLTAISNHNGEISNEVRLIYVTEQETGLPIFFRYCPGNVVDVSTLVRTLAELKAHGVKTKHAILDAGYYSDENFAELYNTKICFVTRMKENRKLFKELVASHIPDIQLKENIVGYNGRYAFIKCVECELLPGRKAYAYVGLDLERKDSENKKLFAKAKAEALTDGEVYDRYLKHGRFVLVSSKRIKTSEILPVYYTRQQIEQVFDIGKNYAHVTPLRVQTEDTFRGHLLLTFIATALIKKLQDRLKDSPYNPISLFLNMRNQKCKVFDKMILTQEPFKKANDYYKLLGIECPVEIPR